MICVMDISRYFVMIIILFVNYIFMFNIEFLFWNSCFFFMVNNDIMVCSIFIVYMFFFILDIYNMLISIIEEVYIFCIIKIYL